MGRSPCCNKEGGTKRRAWTADEDKILTDYITAHGEGNWRSIPKRAGLKRCGKSCRLRWLNYLRPDIKIGNITRDEEDLIVRLHRLLGNRWSLIAGRLPGRTDNEIKNYWNSYLSKRVRDEHNNEHEKTSDEVKIANDEPKTSTPGPESKKNSRQMLSPAVVVLPPQLPLPLPEDLVLNLDFAVNANVLDNLSPSPSMSREDLSSDIAIGMMPDFFESDFSCFDEFRFGPIDLVLEGDWRSLQGVEEAMDYTALGYTSDQWIV